MRFAILSVFFSMLSSVCSGQFVYKIKADSVKITNDSCTAELILESSTKDIKGFLFNKGNGRTTFKKGLIKLNDSLYLIGADTLNISNSYAGTTTLQQAITASNILTTDNRIDAGANKLTIAADTTYLTGNVHVDDGNPVSPLFVPAGGLIVSANSNRAGIKVLGASNTFDTRPLFYSVRSRGTLTSPANVQNGDWLLGIIGAGMYNNGIAYSGGLEVKVDGEPTSATNVPASVSLSTGTFGGNRTARLLVNSAGRVLIGTGVTDNGYSIFQVKGNSFFSDTVRFKDGATMSSINGGAGGNVITLAHGDSTQRFFIGRLDGTAGGINIYGADVPGAADNKGGIDIETNITKNASSALRVFTRENSTYTKRFLINRGMLDASVLDSFSIGVSSGVYKLRNLLTTTDTSNKLMVYNTTTKELKYMTSWQMPGQAVTVNSSPINSGASNRILFQNSSNQVSQSSRLNWSNADSVLAVAGSLQLTGTGTVNFNTPQGSVVATKIGTPVYDPGNYGQIMMMGLPAGAINTSRVLSLLDNRSSAHQPTLAIFNPAETNLIGFSWDGSNTAASIKTTGGDITIRKNTTDIIYINTTSLNTGLGGNISPTAKAHLAAGSATANTAPLKFSSGTNLTTPEDGSVEYNGTNYFVTTGSTRYTLAKTLTATSTLNFASTAAQSGSNLTITVTGAADGDAVSLGVPNAAVNANSSYSAWVSAANTVTVRFNNYSSAAIDPASGTFRVSIVKY